MGIALLSENLVQGEQKTREFQQRALRWLGFLRSKFAVAKDDVSRR